MEDLIHINEKWFYLMKDGQHFIIVADEEEPYRHVQHKSFLMKIMFLCAVARPRYDTNKNAWLDRKIGNDGGNDYKIPHMGKKSMERRGLLPGVLNVTPAASAWLNPMMDDDSSQDSDDLDDAAHIPITTATPTVEMDGEGGENATTDEIMNTGV